MLTVTRPRIWRRLHEKSTPTPKLQLMEPLNRARLGAILHAHRDDIIKDRKGGEDVFTNLQKTMTNTSGSLRTSYEQSNYHAYRPEGYTGATSFGRSWAKSNRVGNIRAQRMPRAVRNTLFYDTHSDIDIACCFPTLLIQAFDHLDLPLCRDYVARREEYLNMFPELPPQIVKKAVNNLISGAGKFAAMQFGPVKEYGKFISKNPFFQGIYQEIQQVQEWLLTEYNGFCELVNAIPDGSSKSSSVVGLSHFLQDIENSVIVTMFEHLRAQFGVDATEQCILVFDGMLVPTPLLEDPSILDGMVDAVKRKVGVDIELKVKPMEPRYEDCVNIHAMDVETDPTESYDQWKTRFETNHYKIRDPVAFVEEQDDNHRTYCNLANFRILLQEENKEFMERWFNDPQKRMYQREDFYPNLLTAPAGHMNTYRGLRAASLPPVPEEEVHKLVIPIINHLKLMAGMSKKATRYTLNYCAQFVQHPETAPRTALGYRARQGTGKDTFWQEFFGELVLGDWNYISVDNLKTLYGDKHSLLGMDKLLVIVSEEFRADFVKYESRAKNMITAPKLPWRPMYISTFYRNNAIRMVMFAQDPQAIVLEGDDRRFMITDCDGALANNAEYFTNLRAKMLNDRVARAFYQYLMRHPVGDWNPIDDRPMTSRRQAIVDFNVSPVIIFIADLVDKEVGRNTPVMGPTPSMVTIRFGVIRDAWTDYVNAHFPEAKRGDLLKRGKLTSDLGTLIYDGGYMDANGQPQPSVIKMKVHGYDVYTFQVAEFHNFIRTKLAVADHDDGDRDVLEIGM